MSFVRKLASVVPALIATVPLLSADEAKACGGFFPPTQTVEVASHRMILSVSQTQSTLYDQIKYGGSPSDFGWVLPIKGTVTVGLSSDALFDQLDQLTAVTVTGPDACPCSNGDGSSGAGGSLGLDGGGVTVVAEAVVGPYQTVQLSSANPTALADWLSMNAYPVPSDVQPIIAAYVSGGFDFLAIKLVPGMGIESMKPVSVTTPGASPVLPLRMVTAGVGATVPITLFVLGEGRYEPTNFPTFTIDPTKLVWDFNANASNYGTLRDQGFAATAGKGWLVESALPMAEGAISGPLDQLVQIDPTQSGYADSMGNGAPAAEMADLTTLFSGIAPQSLFITRMTAELPVAALSSDLTIGASTSQTSVPNNLFASQFINAPPCPCGTGGAGTGGAGTGGIGSGAGTSGGTGGMATSTAGTGGGSVQGGSSCAVGASSDGASIAVWGVLAALANAARRRRRVR